MEKIKIIFIAMISAILIAPAVFASEIIGNLSTGIGNNGIENINAAVIVAPLADPLPGTYTAGQSIVLFADGPSIIRYNINGVAPNCVSGNVYSGPIDVNQTLVIKAIACYENDYFSPVVEFAYIINLLSLPAVSSNGSSGGGGISGGGSNILKITKAEPRVAGIATEDISQMTREEKLQRIAEIRLLLIQLIQQLIAELQKQLVAIKS